MIATLFLSSFVHAQNMTRIDADFRCNSKGGEIAVKVGPNASTARIWQTDPGEKTGIELEVTDFKIARCLGCYSFNALLMGSVEVRGTIKSYVLKYEAFNPETNKWEALGKNLKCSLTK